MEEIFYVAYVRCSTYLSFRQNRVCEIEKAMEELLELRKAYMASIGAPRTCS